MLEVVTFLKHPRPEPSPTETRVLPTPVTVNPIQQDELSNASLPKPVANGAPLIEAQSDTAANNKPQQVKSKFKSVETKPQEKQNSIGSANISGSANGQEITKTPDVARQPAPPLPKAAWRNEAQRPKVFRHMQQAQQRSDEARTAKEKSNAQAKLDKLRGKIEVSFPAQREFADLNGQPIGKVRCSAEPPSQEQIILGPTYYLRGASFDFATSVADTDRYRRQQRVDAKFIRFTALLTEDGISEAKLFVRSQLRQKLKRVDQFGKTRQPPRGLLNDIIEGKLTFDFKVDGLPTHINMRGKVEVFLPLDSGLVRVAQPHKGFSTMQNKRFEEFTSKAMLKRWILSTNHEFNDQVESGFRALSHALHRILSLNQP